MSSLLPTTTAPTTPPLWFDVPAQFTQIDLAEAAEERVVRLVGQFGQAMPDTTDEQRLHLALVQQAMVEQMLGAGAVYAATYLARNEYEGPARLVVAQLTVLVHDLEGANVDMLEAIAAGLQDDEDAPRDVGLVELPAGQALAVVEDNRVTTPVTAFGEPEENAHHTRQAQLSLAFPDEKRIVTFAMSTECLSDWLDLLEIFVGVARTVSFNPPGGSAITRALNPKGPPRSKPTESGTPRRSISDILAGNTD